jgi:error-prone DNA polymerase
VFENRGVGFNNPAWTWRELEQTLSGRVGRDGRAPGSPSWNAGGDSPAWGRTRQPFEAPDVRRRPGGVPYAELHCHSNFSFLDGASHPEELVTEAARLGLEALALTDHDGLYGVVRFAEAAREVGLPTVFGAEITLTPGLDPTDRVARAEADTCTQTRTQVGTGRVPDARAPDPAGRHLVVLADGAAGYGRLARSLSLGHLAGEKGAPQFTLADVADATAGHVWALTGCRKGSVPAALVADGPAAARRELDRLVEAFGRDRVLVELWDHGDPLDTARNDALAEVAARSGVECVATNNVHYAVPAQRRLATALAAVRSRRSLDELDPWLPAGAGAHLRSGAEQARRFARYPGVVERAAEIGRAAAFDLSLVAPSLPPFPCPPGRDGRPLTEMAYLRHLVSEGPAPLRRASGPARERCHGRRRRRPLAAGPGVAHDRPRARRHRAARLPRLLPRGVGPRGVLPPQRHLLPGPGERRQLGGVLRARRHRRRRRVARAAVRAVLVDGT